MLFLGHPNLIYLSKKRLCQQIASQWPTRTWCQSFYMVSIGQLYLCNSLGLCLFHHTHIGLYQFSVRKTTLPVFTQPWQYQNCTPAQFDLPLEKGQGWDEGDEEGRVAAQPTRPLCPSTDPASHSTCLKSPSCHWVFTWLPEERPFRGREMVWRKR